ncbi:hypothetical protein CSC14_0293 [Proteus mirabilis]|nr:hypothetical protein CSC14_0293 [Proteus mirabilis]
MNSNIEFKFTDNCVMAKLISKKEYHFLFMIHDIGYRLICCNEYTAI